MSAENDGACSSTDTTKIVELSPTESEAVAGGINPQPLPPIVERD